MSSAESDGDRWQVVSVVIVLVVVVAAVFLLQRTLNNAREIDAQAANIAKEGKGINISTDSIVQLDRTNTMGKSILATAQPLQGQLDEIIGLASSIDNKATSINNSAVTINGTAKAINGSGSAINSSARGINGRLSEILDIANSIKGGVVQINNNVDVTTALARAILADTNTIVGQAGKAAQNAACIDDSLGGTPDGHCRT